MAGKALVENQISFSHLPTKLKERIEGFTESWEPERLFFHQDAQYPPTPPSALKEVEVVGWEEMRREIPSYTELGWMTHDLDELLDTLYDRDAEIPGPVSWPVGGVKVE